MSNWKTWGEGGGAESAPSSHDMERFRIIFPIFKSKTLCRYKYILVEKIVNFSYSWVGRIYWFYVKLWPPIIKIYLGKLNSISVAKGENWTAFFAFALDNIIFWEHYKSGFTKFPTLVKVVENYYLKNRVLQMQYLFDEWLMTHMVKLVFLG